jgi:hypothetical protein
VKCSEEATKENRQKKWRWRENRWIDGKEGGSRCKAIEQKYYSI